MRGQLERLVEATKLPNVTLQVLPFDSGAHPAMVGSFSVLRFPDQELPDVVYLEHLTSALYLNKPDEVDQYLHVMETICVRAAAPDQTVELLEQILEALQPAAQRRTSRHPPHARPDAGGPRGSPLLGRDRL